MRAIRTAARALIIQEGRLLTILMRRPGEVDFHILPGGGQAHGETLEQSLRRECLEEIGVEPVIGSIAYVREYIGKNHTFHRQHRFFHQLEMVFHCQLPPQAAVAMGKSHDKHQVGVEWVPLAVLPDTNFYPAKLKSFIARGADIRGQSLYLGDIN